MGRPHVAITRDDIDFDTPHTTRRIGHARCAVCQLPADALLCRECLSDIPAARKRVLAWLNGNMDQANALLDDWDHVRAPRQAAWEAIQDARDLSDYAARCAKHRAAGNVYGKLLDAHAAYELALQPLDAERKRLEKAMEVIDGLRLTGSVVACRDCSTHFEDLNGHKLCDACLCEHINGAGILELDGL